MEGLCSGFQNAGDLAGKGPSLAAQPRKRQAQDKHPGKLSGGGYPRFPGAVSDRGEEVMSFQDYQTGEIVIQPLRGCFVLIPSAPGFHPGL